jgi:hypothetical protein
LAALNSWGPGHPSAILNSSVFLIPLIPLNSIAGGDLLVPFELFGFFDFFELFNYRWLSLTSDVALTSVGLAGWGWG